MKGSQENIIHEDDEITILVGVLRTNDDKARFEVQNKVAGIYGDFSIDQYGDWTYVLDNDNPKTHALRDGDRVHDVFPVSVSNVKEETLTTYVNVTILGKDDRKEPVKPKFVIDDDMSRGVVTENDRATEAIGKLYTNMDDAVFEPQSEVNGVFGTFSITKDGCWRYKLDNSREETIELNTIDKRIETFRVSAKSPDNDIAVNEVRIIVLGKDEEIPLEEQPLKFI